MNKKTDEAEEASNRHLATLRKHKWKTTIKSILSEDFELEDEYAATNTTIEDALSHRSGLAPTDLIYGGWMGADPKSIVRVLRYLGPLSMPFRTGFQYNNLMYSVVGEVAKAVTGLDCKALLKSFIWEPLDMNSTFWATQDIPETKKQYLSRGYYWVSEPCISPGSDGYYVPEAYVDFAGIAPAGATISSVNDYGKWLKELLGSAAKGQRQDSDRYVLTPGLFAELTSPRISMPPLLGGEQNQQLNLSAYGLAWMIQPPIADVDHPILRHSGSLTGYGTQLFLLPNDDFGCVCIGNSNWAKFVGEIICLELIAKKLGVSDKVKRRIIDLVKAKVPPMATEESAGQNKADMGKASMTALVSAPAIPASRWSELVQDFIGDYSHPAYGTFRISQYDSTKDDRIVYMPWVPCMERKARDQRRSQNPCLLVSPVGHRTWTFRILLHVRNDFDQAFSVHVPIVQGLDEYMAKDVFFDHEFFDGHGWHEEAELTNPSPVADEASSQGDKTIVQQEVVWNSQFIAKLSAAFHFEPAGSANSSSEGGWHKFPSRLGLRLAEALDGTDGNKDPGWEKDMVWFTKAQP